MRTEQEMMDLILGVAAEDERIRAVYMNGSRVDPNVAKDQYRDYDVVFVVAETASFIEDKNWVSRFGDPLIVQEPGYNDISWGIAHDFTRRYAWLMLFKDGTRIDLVVEIKEEAAKSFLEDTLTISLLDKDKILPEVAASNDSGHWIRPPGKDSYRSCCNEFWWCLNNVAKGIVRDQLPFAMRMHMQIVHAELEKMVEWRIGINSGFSISTGMWGKHFKKHLPSELYDMYTKTYPDSNYDNMWTAIYIACDLFHILALSVADHFSFAYCQEEEDGMRGYLRMMQEVYAHGALE